MILRTLLRSLLAPDTQKLINAGFLSEDLHYTSRGREVLRVIIMDTYKDKFLAKADEQLELEAKEKNCNK